MWDKEKVVNGLNALYDSMHKNQCYACSYEFVETAKEFGTEILAEAIEFIERQPDIVRCKDCKHYDETQRGTPRAEKKRYVCDDFNPPDDWFCADWEQKES